MSLMASDVCKHNGQSYHRTASTTRPQRSNILSTEAWRQWCLVHGVIELALYIEQTVHWVCDPYDLVSMVPTSIRASLLGIGAINIPMRPATILYLLYQRLSLLSDSGQLLFLSNITVHLRPLFASSWSRVNVHKNNDTSHLPPARSLGSASSTNPKMNEIHNFTNDHWLRQARVPDSDKPSTMDL